MKLAIILFLRIGFALHLDHTEPESIKRAAHKVADQLLTYYHGHEPGQVKGMFDAPIYWWQSGSAWNAFIDYYRLTNDSRFIDLTIESIETHIGENFDMLPSRYRLSQGNDDQAFWTFTVMSAAETFSFPNLNQYIPSWLAIAQTVFEQQAQRWNDTEQYCGGGLPWQIFRFNRGYYYKNSVSSNSFFLLAARLARFTGDTYYSDWANKIWNWTKQIGFLDDFYSIYDGADMLDNCKNIDKTQWTYNNGLLLSGCAFMWNLNEIWRERTIGLIRRARAAFVTNNHIVFEPACEVSNTCNNDQKSFKGYLVRFFGHTIQMAPFSEPYLAPVILSTGKAAAKACNGGPTMDLCGMHWYYDSPYFDGFSGMPTSLAALEAIQTLLLMHHKVPVHKLDTTQVEQQKGNDLEVESGKTPEAKTIVSYYGGDTIIASLCTILLIVLQIMAVFYLANHRKSSFTETGLIFPQSGEN